MKRDIREVKGNTEWYDQHGESDGWIKLSERKPTEKDADEKGRIIFRWDSGSISYQQWNDEWVVIRPKTTFWAGPASHWHPLPKFEEVDQDEGAFEQWAETFPWPNCSDRRIAKNSWDAALAYARCGAKG